MPCAVSSLSARRRAPAWEKTRVASPLRGSGRFRIVPALPEHLEAVILRTDAGNASAQARDSRSPLEKGLGQYQFVSSLLSAK